MPITLTLACPRRPTDTSCFRQVSPIPSVGVAEDTFSEAVSDFDSGSSCQTSQVSRNEDDAFFGVDSDAMVSDSCISCGTSPSVGNLSARNASLCKNGCGRKSRRKKHRKRYIVCCNVCSSMKKIGHHGHDTACNVRNHKSDSYPWYWEVDGAIGGGPSLERRMKTLLQLSLPDAEVVRCCHTKDEKLWGIYAARRGVIRQNGCEKSSWLRPELMPYIGRQLKSCVDKQVNEVFLFHGTTSEAAHVIAQNGFQLPSKPSNFGKGLYFSDIADKCIKYSAACIDGDRVILLCRVTLGGSMVVDGPHNAFKCRHVPDDPNMHSLIALTSPREFVVYDPAQVYPEYMIRFRLS